MEWLNSLFFEHTPLQAVVILSIIIAVGADNVLSQIILDSTAAADQIPKDSRGRFLTYDGTLFQAFWFEEKNWH